MDTKNYTVWEPAIEKPVNGLVVEASSPGQAAFLTAAKRPIGNRSADYVVSDGKQRFDVKLVPEFWHRVESVSEPYDPLAKKTADAS